MLRHCDLALKLNLKKLSPHNNVCVQNIKS